jgi:hypothetical protein
MSHSRSPADYLPLIQPFYCLLRSGVRNTMQTPKTIRKTHITIQSLRRRMVEPTFHITAAGGRSDAAILSVAIISWMMTNRGAAIPKASNTMPSDRKCPQSRSH